MCEVEVGSEYIMDLQKEIQKLIQNHKKRSFDEEKDEKKSFYENSPRFTSIFLSLLL